MKQIRKDTNTSLVILQDLRYPQDRKGIEETLKDEQDGFCAYYDGYYYIHDDDVEAKNLRDFLKINEYDLGRTRQNYIKALKDLGKSPEDLREYLQRNPIQIRFRRAIEAEFGISI